MIDLGELKRLCNAAEVCDWTMKGPSKPTGSAPEGGDFAIICGSDIIAETFRRSDYETTHNAKANAELICALRNAAPELIAMARRYQWIIRQAWFQNEAEFRLGMSDEHIFPDDVSQYIDAAMKEAGR